MDFFKKLFGFVKKEDVTNSISESAMPPSESKSEPELDLDVEPKTETTPEISDEESLSSEIDEQSQM